jgi:hypothetical protein
LAINLRFGKDLELAFMLRAVLLWLLLRLPPPTHGVDGGFPDRPDGFFDVLLPPFPGVIWPWSSPAASSPAGSVQHVCSVAVLKK